MYPKALYKKATSQINENELMKFHELNFGLHTCTSPVDAWDIFLLLIGNQVNGAGKKSQRRRPI